MPIFCTRKIWQSGNHGRIGETNTGNGTSQLINASTCPQPSEKSFIAPSSVPVKKTPSIKDIIEPPTPIQKTTLSETEEVKTVETPVIQNHVIEKENKEISPPISLAETKIIVEEEPEEENFKEDCAVDEMEDEVLEEQETMLTAQDEKINPQHKNDDLQDLFSEQWKKMFDLIFGKIPLIYFPLKDDVPVLKNNIIVVQVKNAIQKEHFESRLRLALEYLRNNFSETLENIEIVVNEKLEGKKIIYNSYDKLNNLKEQNAELSEFLDILKLKVKDS
ncbi:MAG: hypothetical protein RR034_03150 [Bacteroidales bacterium]